MTTKCDGRFHLKCQVHQVFNFCTGSKDRLRHVQGLSNLLDTQAIDVHIEDTTMLGKPVVVEILLKYEGFKLKVGESDMKTIKGEDLQNENVVIKFR